MHAAAKRTRKEDFGRILTVLAGHEGYSIQALNICVLGLGVVEYENGPSPVLAELHL